MYEHISVFCVIGACLGNECKFLENCQIFGKIGKMAKIDKIYYWHGTSIKSLVGVPRGSKKLIGNINHFRVDSY